MYIKFLLLFAVLSGFLSTCAGEDDTRNTSEEILPFETYKTILKNDISSRLTANNSTTGIVSNLSIEEVVIQAIGFISRGINIADEVDGNTEEERSYTLTDSSSLIQLDCTSLPEDTPSGVFTLDLEDIGTHSVRTFCDQETDEGGWTVILRRVHHEDLKASTNFNRTFIPYRIGFGDPMTDFWIGLQYIHLWTNYQRYELRVILTNFDDETAYAHYDQFHIEGEEAGYKLRVSGYRGDAGDALQYQNDMKFSTYDLDQDRDSGNCAVDFGGGWWYSSCFDANLMAEYSLGSINGHFKGIQWKHWKDDNLPLKAATMMIRRIPYNN